MPKEHMEFAFENGMDALALTDHGNMNGLAYQVLHAKKMKKEGKEFKAIYGIEAYFHPSIKQWKKDKTAIDEAKRVAADEKKKKAGKKPSKARAVKEEEVSAATVEDEDASKQAIKNVVNKRRHLILLAQNQTGLENLFQLVSKSFVGDNFYRFPRLDYEMLREHNEGLIVSSACLGGVYAGDFWEFREEGEEAVLTAMRETTRNMTDIFGDRWYGELQWNAVEEQHQLNQLIIKVCAEFGVKLISTADSHYPNPEAWKDRMLYKRLAWGGKTTNTDFPSSREELDYELYPKNGDEMWESYKAYSEKCGVEYDDDLVAASLEETYVVAHERIESFVPDNTVRLPSFVVPEGTTAELELSAQVNAGYKAIKKRLKLNPVANKVYKERIEHELGVINTNDFAGYFLTMKAIADKGNQHMLSGPARGSAAGSLVAYCLNITQVDPIKHDLMFERFMTENQRDNGFPDIDHDVSSPMELKDILIEDWGNNTVVPITNWNTLQLRSLIKDISKFYSIPFIEVNVVTNKMMFEATPRAKAAHGIKAGMYVPTFEEVMEYSDSLSDFLAKYPQVKTHIQALHGAVKSASRHAGGILVSENLDKHMPLINSKGVRQTPWSEGMNVHHLEPMGFIKFDILGLASLRMIEICIKHVLRRHHGMRNPTFKDVRKYYDENLHPDVIDLEDQNVYRNIFQTGKWAGIFQFTESGAQKLCMRAKPSSIVDISAITSIYRPGPLEANVDKKYLEAKEYPEEVEYLNADAKEVTEDTFGFLVFQEQIASLASKLGKDLSLDEGNKLRKLLTKRSESKDKDVIYQKFMDGCTEKKISSHDAQELWQKFEFFSGYGFNKCHATSYSILSFQCAWLMNYYESEWLASFLDKESDTKREKAISIAKNFGYDIAPLSVNNSGESWGITEDGKTLVQPLTSIKGFGDKAMKEILDYRPFNTLEEFLFHPRVSYSKLNKKNLDVLCRSGALTELMDERFTGGKHFWSAVAVDRPRKLPDLIENIEKYSPEGEFSSEEKINNTIELTGQFPMNMVMTSLVRSRIEGNMIPPLGEYDEELGLVWFIPRSVTVKQTKRGKDYWIIDCIDDASQSTRVRCWGVKKTTSIVLNRPYIAKLEHDPNWGFSTRSVERNFRLVG
jgi:DNA polymerase-3 subunit alpha